MKKRMVIKNIIMMNVSPFTSDRENRILFRVKRHLPSLSPIKKCIDISF